MRTGIFLSDEPLMYEVSVEGRFSAAHRVHLPSGELEPVHGHDWRVTVTFKSAALDNAGMVVDFVLAEKTLNATLAAFDHTDLNECPMMRGRNPSAEWVARTLFEILSQNPALNPTMTRVNVEEAPGCHAAYEHAG